MGTDEGRGIQTRQIEEQSKISEDEASVERPWIKIRFFLEMIWSKKGSDARMTERQDIILKYRTDKVYFQEQAEIHSQKFHKPVLLLSPDSLPSIEVNFKRPF